MPVDPGAEPIPAFEALYDDAPCGLLVTRTDGTILRVNRSFCACLGRTAEELVGRVRLQALFTMGGRIFHQTHWQPLLAMQGSIAEVKFELLHRDGGKVPMMLNVVRRQHGGGTFDEISAVVAEARNQYERELVAQRERADALARKEKALRIALHATQERLNQALHAGALYVWGFDVASQEFHFDDGVSALLGFASVRAVGIAEVRQALHRDDLAGFEQALERALRHANLQRQWSCRLEGRDGVQRWVRFSGHGFFDETGELSQFVGVLQDVTESTRQQALAVDRALFSEQMIGIVSHDLRNPLAAIRMAAELLARSELPARASRAVTQIEASSGKAVRLVADLLDFTLTRAGKRLVIQRRPIDLHEHIDRAIAEVAMAQPGRTLRHLCEGPGAIMGDGDRLAQACGNLISNALAYGDPDAPITVMTAVRADVCHVSVHNFGERIPAVNLEAIFMPMTRGDAGEFGARSVGLGLFIVREIALAHGGQVSVTSDAQDGTTFLIALPHVRAVPDQGPVQLEN